MSGSSMPLVFLFCFPGLGTEHRTSFLLEKSSTMEPCTSPLLI